MGSLTRTRIIRIGNSRGLRISKVMLQQAGLDDEVEIEAMPDRLIIRPVRPARAGWDEAFRQMAASGDDRMDSALPSTAWDESEWEW